MNESKKMANSTTSGQFGVMAAVILLLITPLLAGCLHSGGNTDIPESNENLLYGCTDSSSLNYNASAEVNDTSCQYEVFTEPVEEGEPSPPIGNQTELEEQAQATIDLWEGESRLLLILVHPTDSTPGMSATEAESIMSDVNDWYVEVSGGKVWLNWTIAGWYALDDAGYLMQKSYQAAAEDGYDLTQYDRFVVGLQNLTTRSMSTQGVQFYNVTTDDGTVQLLASRCDVKRFADTNSTRNTLTHEMGHGFGLSHARFNGSVHGDVEQYGNQFDTMGSSSAWRHFGAVYKHQMGWLDDEQVELVSQNGNYTLKPLEGGEAHALRLSIGMVEEEMNGETIIAEHFYYLEVREVQETDSSNKPGHTQLGVLNGVIINHAAPLQQYGYHKWLATAQDATPETPTSSSADFLLPQGRTFSIDEADIHITALSVTDDETTVHIEFGNGVSNSAPTISSVEATPTGDGYQFSVVAEDVDNDDLAIFWNFETGFGDIHAPERIGSGNPVEHTFADNEGRRVSVLVSDMHGKETTSWVDLNGYVNQAPQIAEMTPTSVEEGVFQFETEIVDQQLLSYIWDLGDGTTSTLPEPLHEYAEDGNYTVNLIVSDGEFNATVTGYADTADTENSPPIADAGPDITATPGQTVSLDGSGSNDPDNYPLAFIRYFWSSTDGINIQNVDEAVASLVAPNEAGTYIIRLQVNDGAESRTDTMLLTVSD